MASTLPEGGAAAAGLRVGDHIVAVDGIRVTNFPSLQEQLSKHRPGDRVNLTLERKSQSLELNVTLTDRAGTTALSERRLKRLATEPTPQPKPVANTTDLKAWGVTLEKVPQDLLKSLNLRGGARWPTWGLIVAATRPQARLHRVRGWPSRHGRRRCLQGGPHGDGGQPRRHVD